MTGQDHCGASERGFLRSLARPLVRCYGIHGPSRGKHKILRAIIPGLLPARRTIAKVRAPHGFTMCLDLSEAIQNQAYFFGYFESFLVPVFLEWAEPGSAVVDGGANFGQFSLLAAKVVGREGLVLAYEPAAETFRDLQRNVELNDFRQVVCKNAALSNATGYATLYVPQARDSGTASLSRQAVVPYHREIAAAEVRLERLDDLLDTQVLGGRRVSLIKLDIQGAELEALHGSAALAETHRPVLIIEADEATSSAFGYSPRDLCAYLVSLQYSLFGVSPKKRGQLDPFNLESGTPVPHDVVCIPKEGAREWGPHRLGRTEVPPRRQDSRVRG